MNRRHVPVSLVVVMTAFLWFASFAGNAPAADEAFWIWSPKQEMGEVPRAACHFRRSFSVSSFVEAKIYVAADDQYEMYVNGRRIGSGGSTDELDEYDISQFIKNGRNLVAIKVTNTDGATAALGAHIAIRDEDGQLQTVSSDDTWATSLGPLPFWYTPLYNDSRWASAEVLGVLGKTPPWDDVQPQLANARPAFPEGAEVVERLSDRESEAAPTELVPGEPTPAMAEPTYAGEAVTPVETTPAESSTDIPELVSNSHEEESFSRAEPSYQVPDGFQVEMVLDPEETGSLVAMTFNEFGHIIAARDGGELLLIYDSDKDGQFDRTRVYCDQVRDCQGILCLNGDVFVSAAGPEGIGVYRLSDEDRDGQLEKVVPLFTMDCKDPEYGPHGLALGPDGMLYVALGCQSKLKAEFEQDSPYRGVYEGDLAQPRYEDPTGTEKGATAPGGAIVRTDIDGSGLQLVAGGLRNSYDLAFSTTGGLLAADNDSQADLGSPWYRSSGIYHIVPGGEYGWRSGWAKWPEYYLDRLPAALDLGRTVPTGMVVYDHVTYPSEYRGSLFLGQWREGRILTVKLAAQGSTCTASSEVFVNGDSMNVSDLDVGPDGMLYFATGGRDATGGIYRVRWTGYIDPAATNLGTGLSAVIRQPQLQSAWARQRVATQRAQLGESWDEQVPGVAVSAANPWNYRIRALDLMQLYGPAPNDALLIELARAKNERVRGKAADLMGLHPSENTQKALIGLLEDSDRGVRRKACEALVRSEASVSLDQLVPLLRSDDRFESWAARRLLERMPVEEWQDELLASNDHRLLVQGGMALMIAHADKPNAILVLQRLEEAVQGFVSDQDFIDMLRLMQVAMHRGGVTSSDIPTLRDLIADEFPAGDTFMNRELIRLVSYLQIMSIKDRYLEHLQSNAIPQSEKVALAMHLTLIPTGWSIDERIQIFDFLQKSAKAEGSGSYAAYLASAARDFAKSMSPEESLELLTGGEKWPAAALGVLYNMPQRLDTETFELLKQLDDHLAGRDDLDAARLKVGIVAVMARSGDPASLEHLRRVWRQDAERRQSVAIGLAQWPTEENWEYLVGSLPILQGEAAREILVKLRSIDHKATSSEDFRQVLLRGVELQEAGSVDAVALLEHWTGEQHGDASEDWQAALDAWRDWYAQQWPTRPEARLPEIGENTKWHYDRLLHYLTSEQGRHGDLRNGQAIFEQAMCAKCHRFGVVGSDDAPDLTTIAQRSTRKQMLESILYPSQTIPPEMTWEVVITNKGRQYSGLVTSDASGAVTVVQGDGTATRLTQDQIDQLAPIRVSAMPSYLIDGLELDEVADLFAFLRSTPRTHLAEGLQTTTTE